MSFRACEESREHKETVSEILRYALDDNMIGKIILSILPFQSSNTLPNFIHQDFILRVYVFQC